MRAILTVTVIFLLFNLHLASQENAGTIKGKIVNAYSQEPLIGVNVMVKGTQKGGASNEKGVFNIQNVPSGSYTLDFDYIGFEKLTKTDVIVRPARITFINAEMNESTLQSDEIVITAGYFQKKETDPLSVVSFNAEEVRRSPAAAGDVSRILSVLPSVSQVADNANDLAVRGGSPFENGFYVDNIPIPNINHFPVQGSSGGPIGMLNTDFIDDVSFYSGGFSAIYGDRLASVMDIKFREGNRDEYDGQIDLSMGGMGGILEGPLFGKSGSVLFAARRSYLDWIVDAIGTGAVPKYGDIHTKMVYDINSTNKISFLSIIGISKINFDPSTSRKNGNPNYGDNYGFQSAAGINWRSVWSSNLFSNTSLSHVGKLEKDEFYKTVNGDMMVMNKSFDGSVRLRNVNTLSINKSNRFEFGFEASYNTENYDYHFGNFINRLGDSVTGIGINKRFNSNKTGAFLSYSLRPVQRWLITLGLRGDYYSYNKNATAAPRISTSYSFTDRLTANASYGIFYQNLPMLILSQNESNKKLKDPKATHYVAGIDYMLTDNTKLSVEAYLKQYEQFPMEPTDPALFVIDDGTSMSRFGQYTNLIDNGSAQAKGVELMIQKKLAQKIYGLISGSVFKSRYRDLNGKWHNRMYDNQYVFNVVGGYKPNNKWEFSLRWTYAGGVPYTPFDVEASRQINSGVIDQTRINKERNPAYHTLNVRFDRRFNFNRSSLVTYLNLYNAYNRKNIAGYYWNEIKNKKDVMYQWSLIPVGGFEYEF